MTWNSTLKRSTPFRARGVIARRSQPMKSKGMKGSPVSAAQKIFHDQLASRIGCVACAMDGRSAQMLVTQALDDLLASMPELDGMAAKAKRKG